jgi:hypothetical protein
MPDEVPASVAVMFLAWPNQSKADEPLRGGANQADANRPWAANPRHRSRAGASHRRPHCQTDVNRADVNRAVVIRAAKHPKVHQVHRDARRSSPTNPHLPSCRAGRHCPDHLDADSG